MGKSKFQLLIRTVFLSYILTAALLLALALGLYRLHFTEAQVGLGVNAIYIVACLIGGFAAGKLARLRRFLWGFSTGALYFLVLLAVSFLINKQIGTGFQELALIFAMCAGSGTIGGMLS